VYTKFIEIVVQYFLPNRLTGLLEVLETVNVLSIIFIIFSQYLTNTNISPAVHPLYLNAHFIYSEEVKMTEIDRKMEKLPQVSIGVTDNKSM
jgi:hypothetical protein